MNLAGTQLGRSVIKQIVSHAVLDCADAVGWMVWAMPGFKTKREGRGSQRH